MRCAGCVPPAACDGARAGEITAKNGLYYLACYRLITDVRITQSQSSIYEFLFPEISLCDETPPCLIRRRRNPGRSVTNLRRTGSRIFSV